MSEDKSEDSLGDIDVWIVKLSGPPILGVQDETFEANAIAYPNPTYNELNVVVKGCRCFRNEIG